MSSASAQPVPALPLRRRARGYLALTRISNGPTVVSNVVAGAVLASVAASGATVALLAAGLTLFYASGMVLNDVCDYAVDRRERPERPLPSGAVSRSSATLFVVLLFATGSALLLAVGRAPFLSGLVLIALIVVYDLWHKGNPFSPLLMAATRVLVYVTAFLAFSTAISAELVWAGALLGLYVVGLTAIAKVAGGRARGSWPVALVLAPAAYPLLQDARAAAALFVVTFVAWTAYAVSNLDRDIGGAVARLVAGISLYDAVVVSAATGLSAAAAVCVAAFAATVFLQRYIVGT